MSVSEGRSNQRRRTRKDLLEAAARLMRAGKRPSLEEVAEEALVSRATAYRYFASIDALLLEAALDVATPQAAALFADGDGGDAIARVERVDDALDEMIHANEPQLRMMLIQSLERGLKGEQADLPPRQNRRSPLIEAALSPSRKAFKASDLDTLSKALALVIGTEAHIVFKDVLLVDDAEAHRVKRWAIRVLVEAAKRKA